MESLDLKPLDKTILPVNPKGFKVSRSQVPRSIPTVFGRRQFFKIVLVNGSAKIRYGSRNIVLNGLSIFFANPEVPYSVEITSELQTGYSCIFSREFIKSLEWSESMQNAPVFKVNKDPAFALSESQYNRLAAIFELMIENNSDTYRYNGDLMRNYLQLLIHETHRLNTENDILNVENASLRITRQFLDLLEKQFPIEHLDGPLPLRTAVDYADKLSIHVNYLNRSVKHVTGKSTTRLIADRITGESLSLLQHTDWSINAIAFALGFEYSNYFSNFIRKVTGHAPSFFRKK